MILADKIMTLRKKAGWSQEELAARLNISRQSVSKWEGAQSIPDMDKVVQMSRLFGVTTDFLLKDELEIEEHTQSEPMDEPPLRRVTMEDASAYLALRREAAPQSGCISARGARSPIPEGHGSGKKSVSGSITSQSLSENVFRAFPSRIRSVPPESCEET